MAWLIKGRMLGDKGNVGKMLYREDNANKGYYETKQFC
jgi:hypothetical protein